jgi:uncharacterized protein
MRNSGIQAILATALRRVRAFAFEKEWLNKWETLKAILLSLNSVLVAYSGGVDSTLLLKVARDTLGEKATAATIKGEVHPQWEVEEALRVARDMGVEPLVVELSVLDHSAFAANPPDRCYHCKSLIFTRLKEIAQEQGLAWVVEGSNRDDLGDYRPGRRALEELAVRSPLLEAGLTKAEIRSLSRYLGLPTWDRPSLACLASRFPYGTALTATVLEQVDRAEVFLGELGFGQRRVRHHGDIARLEIEAEDWPILLENRQRIVARLRDLGYTYVTVDLSGYRTGSMNEVLEGRDER